MTRRIAHLDMDAFYASVELLRYPKLRGVPVVIGGASVPEPQVSAEGYLSCAKLRDYVGRGVITTSTYEARALGIHSGMGLMKAAKLAPDAVLLPVDFDAYRHYSRLFKQAVAARTSEIEDRGIDEIYIDLSQHQENSYELARQLKQAVYDATGLSCSIGIASNKLLAKIASDLEKPDGLTIVEPSDVVRKIWPLPVRKINGIGPKAYEKLALLGITHIGTLAQADPMILCRHFGQTYGKWLHAAANGIDDRPVITHSEPKSISRETTFERDLHAKRDREVLTSILTRLCERIAEDLQRKEYQGRTVGIKLKFYDFRTVTREVTLSTSTNKANVIRDAVRSCLQRVSLDKTIRLLGVRVSTLSRNGTILANDVCYQHDLFFNKDDWRVSS